MSKTTNNETVTVLQGVAVSCTTKEYTEKAKIEGVQPFKQWPEIAAIAEKLVGKAMGFDGLRACLFGKCLTVYANTGDREILRTLNKVISSSLYRGDKKVCLEILRQKCGVYFDSKGEPNQCIDADRCREIGAWLQVGGRKLRMIKLEAENKEEEKFDAWQDVQKFLLKLKKKADASDDMDMKRTQESIAGVLDTLSKKMRGVSIATVVSK